MLLKQSLNNKSQMISDCTSLLLGISQDAEGKIIAGLNIAVNKYFDQLLAHQQPNESLDAII